MRNLFLFLFFFFFAFNLQAQSDSTIVKPSARVYTRYDSVHLQKLNSSGNLMIAAGVGLLGAGSYLIYQGNKVYNTIPDPNSPTVLEEGNRNHKQGTIYYVAGGVGLAGGIVLIALGARNKVEFKSRKKMMELQSGILDNGNIGVALNF